jgi:translation initiation factor SUI1
VERRRKNCFRFDFFFFCLLLVNAFGCLRHCLDVFECQTNAFSYKLGVYLFLMIGIVLRVDVLCVCWAFSLFGRQKLSFVCVVFFGAVLCKRVVAHRQSIGADPFAEDELDEAVGGTQASNYVHIRIQQRNGRKTLTTASGINQEINFDKVLKVFKKAFCCNGTIVTDPVRTI